MKNIHILPTDKPSRLYKVNNKLYFEEYPDKAVNAGNQHIYITNDEEIKEGDKDFYIIANDRDKTWINRLEKVVECKIDPKHGKVLILSSGFIWVDEGKKIILTTDQSLDGVQAIDDEFLEWFVKNPSCEEVEVGYGWIRLAETDNKGYWISIPDKQFEMQQEEPNQIKCYCGHTTMCEDIRKMIDKVKNFNQFINENKKTKYQLSVDKENDRLLNLYPNLKFSSKWNNEFIPRYMKTDNLTFEEEYNKWKIYYTKQLLEPFIKFYNEYKPYSYPKRFGNYEMYYSDDVKQQFDKIIKGDLYVDEEFQIPDSPIRNYMKIYHFDKINIDNYNKK